MSAILAFFPRHILLLFTIQYQQPLVDSSNYLDAKSAIVAQTSILKYSERFFMRILAVLPIGFAFSLFHRGSSRSRKIAG
jgi:hypothetical protein